MTAVCFRPVQAAFAFVLLAAHLTVLAGQSVTLAWDPDPEPDLLGYILYHGTSSGTYSSSIDVGRQTQGTISGLREGATYYFVVTAYYTSGVESEPSNEVRYTIPVTSSLPAIAKIGNQTASEDVSQTLTIRLEGGSAASSLTMWATSSNPLLVPPTSVIFSGTGTNTQAVITPVRNRFGTAMITVNISDGQTTNSQSFILTVAPENDHPIVSSVPDIVLVPNATRTISFFVADAETSGAELEVTAVSSNPVLIPPDNIFLGGYANQRTATLVPAPDQHGSALITFRVSDGVAVTERTLTLTVLARPVLEPIPNQTTNEDTPLLVPFRVADADTPASALTVWAESSNFALTPPSSIVLSGTGEDRTAAITPWPNRFGTSTITLAVTDGFLTNIQVFDVTFSAINDPPYVSPIPEQIIGDGLPRALSVMVSDPELPASALTMTASSSNPSLLPDTGIILAGSSDVRSVIITPNPDQLGTTIITLAVSDGERTTYRIFRFSVTLPAGPDLLPIADQTILEGVPTIVPFEVNDPDTDLSNVILWVASSSPTLISPDSIIFEGIDTNRSATIMPALNQHGTAAVTFFVTDGLTTNSESFTVTVIPVNDPPILSLLPNQVIGINSSLALSFTVADPETSASDLIVEANSSNPILIPPERIVLVGTNYNRLVVITPLPDMIGSATISITVSDGAASTTRNFQVMVQSLLPDGLFAASSPGEPGGQEPEGSTPDDLSAELPLAAYQGTYHGLFYEQRDISHQSSGSIRVNVTAQGTFTGTFLLAGDRLPFIGRFDAANKISKIFVPRQDRTPIQIMFRLTAAGGFQRIIGTVTDDSFIAELWANQVAFSSDPGGPVPQTGRYHLLVTDPNGESFDFTSDGLGTVEVRADGVIYLSGRLADDTKLSQAASLSQDGFWPVYVSLYGGRGSLWGWIQFGRDGDTPFRGRLHWIRPVAPGSGGVRDELVTIIPVIGVRVDLP